MQLEEVQFNHNPASATNDAFTICRDKNSGAIVAPEWRRTPHRREPAAYARDAITGAVTIRARFSGGPQNGTRKIRAIDPNAPTQQQGGCGCITFLVWLIRTMLNSIFGTIGEVLA